MKKLFSLLILLASPALHAAGPGEIGVPDQSLWPDPVQDRASFDAASRSELLVFLKTYGAEAEAPVPGGNEESLRAWRDRFSRTLFTAYRDAASSDCTATRLGCGFSGTTFPELVAFANGFPARLSPRYAPWLAMTEKFDHIYLAEQKRLAGLFPKPTSEILPVADGEILGDGFADRHFLLSFDDGPTPVGGNTDLTLAALEKGGAPAQFFALGDALQPRLDATTPAALAALYGRNCLGSHGYHHKSHQTWPDWKSSLQNTFALIQKLRPQSTVRFRPPFGQRTAEVVAEQQRLANAPVVLWNIDSEDWNDLMPIEKVADRVEKLMLLWRRGIVLMHDIHPKAQVAVPSLFRFAARAGLVWTDCHDLH